MATLEKFKLSALSFDYDKDPKGMFIWLESFGGFVASTEGGPDLEDMLDSKLHRQKAADGAIPSFLLNDPDFGPVPHQPHPPSAPRVTRSEADSQSVTVGSATGTVLGSATSGGSGASGQFSLGQHHIVYNDLPEVSKKLDAVLYNILRSCLRGSIAALITHVRFPSYVQAVCILVKAMDLSRLDRVMAAFEAFDKLAYTGNALLFQTTFMAIKREMDSCRATMTDYIFCKMMRSFDGKSKTIQFKIAADYNDLDPVHRSQVNFYDLIQRYCGELAAVGDGTRGGAYTVAESAVCTHCKETGHKVSNCPKLTKATRKKVKKALSQGENFVICYKCNEFGHYACDCPMSKHATESSESDEEGKCASPGGDAPDTPSKSEEAPQSSPPTPVGYNNTRMTSEVIQGILRQVRTGN